MKINKKHVYNPTFNLPDLKDRVPLGVWDNAPEHVGMVIEGQLPNITGTITRVVTSDGHTADGAFSLSGSAGTCPGYNSGSPQRRIVYFDASRCSSAYKRTDNIVLPNHVKVFWCIKYI